MRIAFDDQDLLFRGGGLRDDLYERIGDERRAPELETVLGRAFEADTIYCRDVNAIRDRVRALDGFPGIQLCRAVLRFLGRMPADGGRVKEDVRARNRREARGLGIPLIPADQHAEASEGRIEIHEAEIAGREIEFFEIERVVRDVHLSIDALELSVGADDGGGVVV